MKTLKTITINLFYITFFVLIITSCHTKHLNKQMAQTTGRQTQESTIIRKQKEWHQGGQIISMIDSGNHQYRINIFPLDTFSFSLQNGFKGKASMIEVVGTRQGVKKRQ